MKAQDLMSQDNNRADAIDKLTMFCSVNGYSYKYTEKKFTITLPMLEQLPITTHITPRGKLIQELDMSIFGPDSGIHEGELPVDNNELTEGETPSETQA